MMRNRRATTKGNDSKRRKSQNEVVRGKKKGEHHQRGSEGSHRLEACANDLEFVVPEGVEANHKLQKLEPVLFGIKLHFWAKWKWRIAFSTPKEEKREVRRRRGR